VDDNPKEPAAAPMSDRIRKLALLGEIMCGLGIVMTVGSVMLAMVNAGWRDHMMFGGMQFNGGPPLPITAAARQLMVYLMVMPVLCQSFALWMGLQLFRGYRNGEIFTQSAALRLNRIGWAIFAMLPVGLLMKVMLSRLLATGHQPADNLSLHFSIADIDVASIAFGLMAIIIGKVLGEAAKLSEENRLFV
jgi:hypothetical protein